MLLERRAHGWSRLNTQGIAEQSGAERSCGPAVATRLRALLGVCCEIAGFFFASPCFATCSPSFLVDAGVIPLLFESARFFENEGWDSGG